FYGFKTWIRAKHHGSHLGCYRLHAVHHMAHSASQFDHRDTRNRTPFDSKSSSEHEGIPLRIARKTGQLSFRRWYRSATSSPALGALLESHKSSTDTARGLSTETTQTVSQTG